MNFRGSGGFGYDPLFLIPEYHRTFGELSARVKHAISHRARASRSSGRSCTVSSFPERVRKPSRTDGHRLQIRPLTFVRLGERQHLRIRGDAPGRASLPIESPATSSHVGSSPCSRTAAQLLRIFDQQWSP